MTTVTTYRLAYLDREVTLCDACLRRDDHELGAIGPVAIGARRGECDGRHHDDHARSAGTEIEIRLR